MRIAFVTSVFPVPWDHTRGRPVYETARALSMKADVHVFFCRATYPQKTWLRPRGFIDGKLPEHYRLPDVTMSTLEYPALPVVSRPLNGYVSAHSLFPAIRNFAPDVVLAYWIYPEGYGALRASKWLGTPCVIGARGSDIRVRDRISSYFTRVALQNANHVLTVSNELRSQAINRYGANPEHVTTIQNGCNTEMFRVRDRSATRQSLGLKIGNRLITFVGRVVEAKGVSELVHAFADLCKENADLQLAIVGDGVYMDSLKAQIRDLGIASRIQLPGAMSPSQVALWISASDLVCLPSYSEGYPNVLVEALASGIPVVATDVGGVPEIVDHECGILVTTKDPIALRHGLQSALDRSWDPIQLASRFGKSWSDVADETLQVCNQVLNSGRRSRQ